MRDAGSTGDAEGPGEPTNVLADPRVRRVARAGGLAMVAAAGATLTVPVGGGTAFAMPDYPASSPAPIVR